MWWLEFDPQLYIYYTMFLPTKLSSQKLINNFLLSFINKNNEKECYVKNGNKIVDNIYLNVSSLFNSGKDLILIRYALVIH